MENMVSIIVPVYNAEKVVGRCIESVLAQDYKNFELLLMDDGSKDGSGKICDEYAAKDARIHVVHKKNSGVSETRNMAMDMAKGTYIQFIDSDDWISPDATGLMVNAAIGKQCDMVIADFYRVVGDRMSPKGDIEEEGVISREQYANSMMQNPANYYYGVIWNKLFRRELIQKHKLKMDPSLNYCEDYIFNMEYIRLAERIYVLHTPIYYYVKTEGSLVSQNMNVKKIVDMKMMVFEYYNQFFKDVLSEEEYEKKQIQIHGFLVAAAGDEFVLPKVFPGAWKVNDREEHFFEGNGIIAENYSRLKFFDKNLDPVAERYKLSVHGIHLMLLFMENQGEIPKEDLEAMIGLSSIPLTYELQKLSLRKFIEIEEIKPEKKAQADAVKSKGSIRVDLLEGSNEIQENIRKAKEAFESRIFEGFTPEEKIQYQNLTEKLRRNIH